MILRDTEENDFDKKMSCETNCGYEDEMQVTGNMNHEIFEVWSDDCGQIDDIVEPVFRKVQDLGSNLVLCKKGKGTVGAKGVPSNSMIKLYTICI